MAGTVITRAGLIEEIKRKLLKVSDLKTVLQGIKEEDPLFLYDKIEGLVIYDSLRNDNAFNIFINRQTDHNNPDVRGIQCSFDVLGGLKSIINATKTKDVVDKIQVHSLIYLGDRTNVVNATSASGGRRRKHTKKAHKTRRHTRKYRS